MGKAKLPELQAYFWQAVKQDSSVSPVVFDLSKHTLRLHHPPNRKGVSFPTADYAEYETQSISLEFTKYVDFRIDIGVALKKLEDSDQEIIALRFFVDCTFLNLQNCGDERE